MNVEEIADAKLGRLGKMQVKRELKALPGVLMPGESIANMAAAKMDGKVGLLCLTDRRVVFLDTGTFGRQSVDDLAYGQISSIKNDRGRGLGSITLSAIGREVEIGNINPKERYEEISAFIRERIHGAAQPSAPAAPDIAGQLQQLAGLRDQGILTPEEFDAKKSELLARM